MATPILSNNGIDNVNTAAFNFTNYGGSPYTSSLLQSLKSMPQFQAVSAQSIQAPGNLYTPSQPYKMDAYQAKDMSNANLPQYDAMRQRISNQYSQQQSQAQDSLDRQFAAMGGGPGNGAQAKQTENLATGIAQQKGQDLLNVEAQEAQTRTALQQQEAERAFQSGEAQKGYAFQAGQSELGRQFQAGLAGAQMGMQAQEFNAGQALQSQEFNQQMGMQQNQFNFDANAKLAGIDQSYQQAQADAAATAYNAELASYQQRHSGGLLGGGGFLGTGIGA